MPRQTHVDAEVELEQYKWAYLGELEGKVFDSVKDFSSALSQVSIDGKKIGNLNVTKKNDYLKPGFKRFDAHLLKDGTEIGSLAVGYACGNCNHLIAGKPRIYNDDQSDRGGAIKLLEDLKDSFGTHIYYDCTNCDTTMISKQSGLMH